jgi:16S rRNA C1402 (ribose-2'-O) methylase RsmI
MRIDELGLVGAIDVLSKLADIENEADRKYQELLKKWEAEKERLAAAGINPKSLWSSEARNFKRLTAQLADAKKQHAIADAKLQKAAGNF